MPPSSSSSPRTPAEKHGTGPAEKHGTGCGQLHCAVCTAHLSNAQQRYCSARCRTRARALRKQLVYCPQCRAPLWLPKSLAAKVRPRS